MTAPVCRVFLRVGENGGLVDVYLRASVAEAVELLEDIVRRDLDGAVVVGHQGEEIWVSGDAARSVFLVVAGGPPSPMAVPVLAQGMPRGTGGPFRG